MVRKKRKIASAQHSDDVLSVKRKRQLSSRLLSEAFPMSAVSGWGRARAHGALSGLEKSVHRQLQSLQAHRRALLDAAAVNSVKGGAGNGGTVKAAQELGSPTHCGDVATFLVHLIAAPASSQFHKISALMLDDAFRLAPDATCAAVAASLRALQIQWLVGTSSNTSSAFATNATSSFIDVTTLSEAVACLLSTSLVSQHVLTTTCVPDDCDGKVTTTSAVQWLLVVQLFQTLVLRLNSELAKAGCCETTSPESNGTLVESAFAHREKDVKKICSVFLKFLQTPTVLAALQRVRGEIDAGRDQVAETESRFLLRLERSVHALAQYLDQILRSHICAKDTLTMASMCMVLLARTFTTSNKLTNAVTFEARASRGSSEIAHSLLRGTLSWTRAQTLRPSTSSESARAPYSDLAKLAICRGLLKGFSVRTLVFTVPNADGDKGPANAKSLLYPTIFEHVHQCCMSSTTDATRTYAFQTLQQWMSTAKKLNWTLQTVEDPASGMTNGARSASASGSTAAASSGLSPTSTNLASSIVNRIQDVVLANWDHKSRSVSHMMPVVFKSLLAAQDQIAETKSQLLELHKGLLELFLSQPPGCRGTYPAIEMLLPKIGARRLLQNVPDFFPRMLRSLLDPANVSSLVAHLVVTVIQQLRLEQHQEEQGQGSSSSLSSLSSASDAAAGAAPVPVTTPNPAAQSSSAEDWVEHIATALTSTDSLLGKQTATYVLPPLIRQGGIENIDRAQRRKQDAASRSGKTLERGKQNTRRRKRKMRAAMAAGEKLPAEEAAEVAFRQKHDVDFAAMLLSNIRGRVLTATASRDDSSAPEMDDESLRACLHVVTAARATVAPALVGSPTGVGSPFVNLFAYMTAEEVERALLHADPSVRFRALRLICVSRQTSRLPSEVEFRLVKQYLPLLMKRYCSFQDANDSLGVADSIGASGEYGSNLVGSSGAAVAAKNSRNNSQSVINGGAGFGRSQTTSLLKHFFTRIHGGVESRRRAHVRVLQAQTSFEQKRRRKLAGAVHVDLDQFSREKQAIVEQSRAELKIVLDRANSFLNWIQGFLLGGVHPGASFERSSTSLELILLMARIWSKKKTKNKNKNKSGRTATEKTSRPAHPAESENGSSKSSALLDERDRRLLEDSPGLFEGNATVGSVMEGVCRRPEHIGILLNATVVTWDRVRELACQILSDVTGGSAGRPEDATWPGYATQDSLVPVLRRALSLAASPRRREYEAGAQIMCLLFSKFVEELEWTLPFEQCRLVFPTSCGMSHRETGLEFPRKKSAVVDFLAHMCEELCVRLVAQQKRMERMVQVAIDGVGAWGYMDMGEDEKDEDEHGHGILMMFRQILPQIAKTSIDGNDEEEAALRVICSKLLQAVLQALQSALAVVADDASTEPEPELESSKGVDNNSKGIHDADVAAAAAAAIDSRGGKGNREEYMARGVVPTTGGGSKPPLRVDCRGHLLLPKKDETPSDGSGNGYGDNGDEDALSKHHQTVVVASWLLVKEGSVLLADMVDHLPLENDVIADGACPAMASSSRRWLISSRQVRLIGQRLVDSLLGLKHMGAISSAGQAFSIICRRLLQMRPALLTSQNDSSASDTAASTAETNAVLDVQDLPRVWLGQLLKLVCPTSVLSSLSDQYKSHQLLVPSMADVPSSLSNHSTVLFFLRRSTGLATAFVSILRAEPFRGAKATLLQACVAGLVGSLSQGLEIDASSSSVRNANASGPEPSKPRSPALSSKTLPWQSRVHALNILKMIFEDSVLAPDLHTWSSCVLRISMLGFCSANWAVRNSSMMLFANLLRHTVGGKVVHSDGSSHNRVTASQFFSRLPLLRDFIEREMTRVVSVERVEGRTSTERSLLYPLLMLLSRLRPSLFEEDLDVSSVLGGDRPKLATTATATLIPLLRECAVTDRHFSARVMAARAMSNLTPSGAPLENMLESIADELRELAESTASTVTKDHNAAHGILLLALALVSSLQERALVETPADSKTSAIANDDSGMTSVLRRLPTVDGILAAVCAGAARAGMNVCTNGIECGSADRGIISVCGHLVDSALQLVAACISAMKAHECRFACLDASMFACLALSLPSERIAVVEGAAFAAGATATKVSPLLVMAGSEMRISACRLLGSVALKAGDRDSSNCALRGLIRFADTHWCPDARQSCIREINNLFHFPRELDLEAIAQEEGLQERLLVLLAKETHAPSYCAELALQMRLLKQFHSSKSLAKTLPTDLRKTSHSDSPLRLMYDKLCSSLWGILQAHGLLLKNKLCAAPAVVAASIRLAGELLGSPLQKQEEQQEGQINRMYTWFTQVAVVNAKQEEQLSDAQKASNFAARGNSNVVPSAEVRLAVAEAIRRSKILVRTTKTNAAIQLQAWDTLLGLMQDDDSRVRTEARRAVCASVPSFEGNIVIASRCMRHAYMHLEERFGKTLEGSSALMQYYFDRLEFHSSRVNILQFDASPTRSKGAKKAAAASHTAKKKPGEYGVRVFDEDRENFFVEHLLEVELVHLAMMRRNVHHDGWIAIFGGDGERDSTLAEFQETMKGRLRKALLAVFWRESHPPGVPAPQKLYIDEGFFRGAYATVLFCRWLVFLDLKHTGGQLWVQPFLTVLVDFEESCTSLKLVITEATAKDSWMDSMRASASKSAHPALREAVVILCKSLGAGAGKDSTGWQDETESCLIFGR